MMKNYHNQRYVINTNIFFNSNQNCLLFFYSVQMPSNLAVVLENIQESAKKNLLYCLMKR